MPNRTVHLAVYDTLADWEYGHLVANLRSGLAHRASAGPIEVRTVGAGEAEVTTMGGLRVRPDLTLDGLTPQDSALLVLPGAQLWDAGDALAPFAKKAAEFVAAGVPVAGICGATAGLARAGLLDGRAHTSAAAGYLGFQEGYQGGGSYREAEAVTSEDGLLITAGPTEPVAFAREALGRLEVMEPEVLDAWYRLFRHSDPSAYEVLEAAGQS
ncbi:DJ-1/PfpI family protein [Kitasatospora sp. NPDC096147]|uniref:DJ-1/PfpI family protein n=1 Tax=Kitasatospora sp. NPDC096147 TaxID=3364093 RepID=UPI00382FBDF3